jgi:hypothetical protein
MGHIGATRGLPNASALRYLRALTMTAEPLAQSRTLALLPQRLDARLFAHEVAAVPCVTWRTRGFGAIGHPELTLTLQRAPDDGVAVVSLDVMRFVTGLYSRAVGGAAPLAPMMTTDFPPALFDDSAAPGVIFTRASRIEGVPLRAHGLHAVVIHRDELALARSCGPRRVLARLARASRHAPFPVWWNAERPPVLHPDDATSALSPVARMTLSGVTAAMTDGAVSLALSPRGALVLREALRPHGDAPFALLVDAPPEADAFLVWEPGQAGPSAALCSGSEGRAVAGNFVHFAPGALADHGALLEDGFAFQLTDSAWSSLRASLDAQTPFSLPAQGRSKGLTVRFEETAPEAPRSARFVDVEVLAGLAPPREGVAPEALARYVHALRGAVTEHFDDGWHAPGQDLLLHVELHPARGARVNLALRPGPAIAALNGLCARAEEVDAPTVTAPVVLRLLYALWGGADGAR